MKPMKPLAILLAASTLLGGCTNELARRQAVYDPAAADMDAQLAIVHQSVLDSDREMHEHMRKQAEATENFHRLSDASVKYERAHPERHRGPVPPPTLGYLRSIARDQVDEELWGAEHEYEHQRVRSELGM